MSRDHGRTRWRGRAGGGVSYDPDAQAYIAATGELFPEALNALVLGIKTAGLWDNHIGSIKKAIGVPSLAASLVDLRNTAFNGTSVNTPGHSATEGWSFVTASSQYINATWYGGHADSKSNVNSVHVALRVMASSGQPSMGTAVDAVGVPSLGMHQFQPGLQRINVNDGLSSRIQTANGSVVGHWIGVRTSANARKVYLNGNGIGSDTQASLAAPATALVIGCRLFNGEPDNFTTGRITMSHAGAGLDDAQAAALTTLFDAYAAAAGET